MKDSKYVVLGIYIKEDIEKKVREFIKSESFNLDENLGSERIISIDYEILLSSITLKELFEKQFKFKIWEEEINREFLYYGVYSEKLTSSVFEHITGISGINRSIFISNDKIAFLKNIDNIEDYKYEEMKKTHNLVEIYSISSIEKGLSDMYNNHFISIFYRRLRFDYNPNQDYWKCLRTFSYKDVYNTELRKFFKKYFNICISSIRPSDYEKEYSERFTTELIKDYAKYTKLDKVISDIYNIYTVALNKEKEICFNV